MLGLFFISSALIIFRRVEKNAPHWKLFLIPGFIAITLFFSLFMHYFYPHMHKTLIQQWPNAEITHAQWWQGDDIQDLLCRNGVFKRQACIFNLQWVGELSEISQILNTQGFTVLPEFKWSQMLGALESSPPLTLSPLPEFHRDRMPVITAIQNTPLPNNTRVVLRLWQSDLKTSKDKPVWIGVIRLEKLKGLLPLVKLYRQMPSVTAPLQVFARKLQRLKQIQIKLLHPPKSVEQDILLIDETRL